MMQEKVEELIDHAKEYANIQYEIAVLKVVDKSSHIISGAVAVFILAFISVFALILLSFAAAYYIAEKTGNAYAGFLIVGGIYLVIGIIVLLLKKQMIEKPVANRLVRSFLKEA